MSSKEGVNPVAAGLGSERAPKSWRQAVAAAGAYWLLAASLFPGLFRGERLSPAASILADPPFLDQRPDTFLPYISDFQGDVWRFFHAVAKVQHAAARDHRFPTWNPYIFCGAPLHANGQSALLHPLHWPYYLADPIVCAGPIAIVKLWLSGWGMFLFARRLGMAPGGAFLSGLAWMLGSFQIRWLLWSLTTATACLPWLLVALDRLVVAPSLRRLALAGLVATVLQLSGHPETQFHVGMVAGVFVLVRLGLRSPPVCSPIGAVAWSSAAMLLGLAGAAAALVPFVLNLLDSANLAENWHGAKPRPDMRWLITLLAPDWFGRPRGGVTYTGPGNYAEHVCWFGAIPLTLAAIALGKAWARQGESDADTRRLCHALALVIGIALALVLDLEPVGWLVRHTPVLSLANHERLVFAIQFAGALLAGWGWDHVMAARGRWAHVAFGILLAALATGLVAAALLRDAGSLVEALTEGTTSRWHRGDVRTMGGALVVALAGITALAGWRRREAAAPWRGVGPVLVGGLAALELWWGAVAVNPTCPAALADPPPPAILTFVIDRAAKGLLVATDAVLIPNLAMTYRFRDLRGYDHPMAQRLAHLWRQLGLLEQLVVIPRSRCLPTIEGSLATLFDKAGVRCLYCDYREPNLPTELTPAGGGRPWPLLVRDASGGAAYENPNAYPRAWIPRTVRAADHQASLAALLDPHTDLREVTVLETEDGRLPSSLPTTAEGIVTLAREEPEHVTLEVDTPTGGVVVLADRMMPGWRVTVNGHPQPAWYANHLFRGVVVPAGRSRVEWVYACPGLCLGSWISVVSLLGMAAALVRRSAW